MVDWLILSSNATALAWNAKLFLVSAILSVAAACHLLDLTRWACVIIDQHNFPRMKHAYAGLFTQNCFRPAASDRRHAQGQSDNHAHRKDFHATLPLSRIAWGGDAGSHKAAWGAAWTTVC
jgi:hypothetical protein